MAGKTGDRVAVDAVNITHRGSLTIEAGANARIIINVLLQAKKRPRNRRKNDNSGRQS